MIAPHLRGGMVAVGLSEADIKPYLEKLEPSESDVGMSYLRQLDLHSTLQADEGDETGELKGSLPDRRDDPRASGPSHPERRGEQVGQVDDDCHGRD